MPKDPSWFEHVDLMTIIIGALFLIIGWFIVRTISKIDKNQTILFERQTKFAEDLYTLKGAHDAIMQTGKGHHGKG